MSEKFESKTQPGLFFWAEPVDPDLLGRLDANPGCWHVVSQVEGYPASEASDDWFRDEKDATAIARELAGLTEPEDPKTLTVDEAFEAWEVADETIRGAESIEELDEVSDIDYDWTTGDLTPAQASLAQRITLRAYEKAIGRA